jgi:hypothetical protein
MRFLLGLMRIRARAGAGLLVLIPAPKNLELTDSLSNGLVAAAFFAAVFDAVPNLLPFLPPLEWAFADNADLFR